MSRPLRRVEPLSILIGVSMTIGYGTLYYPFAILGPEIARDLGWSTTFVFGVFSVALLSSAATTTLIGYAMDRYGARPVMTIGSVVAALTLVNLSFVQSMAGFVVAMLLIEFASRMVQYETGFAALTALHGKMARRPIVHVTLIAGFASTVFWPLIHWLLGFMDWRGVCLVLAGINMLIALPIHASIPAKARKRLLNAHENDQQSAANGDDRNSPVQHDTGLLEPERRMSAFLLLSLAFAGGSFLMSAVHTSFFLILEDMGRTAALAAFAGAIIGPMQVASRVIEMLTGERFPASVVGMVSTGCLLLGLLFLASGLWLDGDFVILAFAASFGVGQGLNFIARALLPARLFGTIGYGAMTGKLATLRLLAVAGAPVCTALAIANLGIVATFTLFGVIALGAFAASWALYHLETGGPKAVRQS